jgi:hypothetical protein
MNSAPEVSPRFAGAGSPFEAILYTHPWMNFSAESFPPLRREVAGAVESQLFAKNFSPAAKKPLPYINHLPVAATPP